MIFARQPAKECERSRSAFSAYLDRRLSDIEEQVVAAHVASCAQCAMELATLRQTVAALGSLPRLVAPRNFTIPVPVRALARFSPWYFYFRNAAAAVAALLLLTLGFGFWQDALSGGMTPAVAPSAISSRGAAGGEQGHPATSAAISRDAALAGQSPAATAAAAAPPPALASPVAVAPASAVPAAQSPPQPAAQQAPAEPVSGAALNGPADVAAQAPAAPFTAAAPQNAGPAAPAAAKAEPPVSLSATLDDARTRSQPIPRVGPSAGAQWNAEPRTGELLSKATNVYRLRRLIGRSLLC